MHKENGKVTGLNIAYIGGGSRGWAWGLMNDLAIEEMMSGTVKLYDIDFDAAYSNELIGNRLKTRDVQGKWDYKAVKKIEDALKDADFVFISILPGSLDLMESDVHAPEKYGIYQSVGDTVGPGGLMRALRTIPIYVEIAEAIKSYAPEAWVVNYTNPMSLCTRTLYEIFPQIKAFGCCHEVFGTQKLLCFMLKDMEGIEGVQRDQIKVNVKGLNHFTWIDKAFYHGIDLMELYEKFVEKYYTEGFCDEKVEWLGGVLDNYNRVKFDLFKRYGLIAAAGDRHLAEFCPQWYLKDTKTVEGWKFRLTRVSERKAGQQYLLDRATRLRNGENELSLKPSGEEGVRQIKALSGLEEFVTNVNLPNRGQVKGLPIGAVVETNAVFGANSIMPVMAGELPLDVHSLVIRHVGNQENILKAALTKNKELAFRAFVNDPLITIDLKDAAQLFETMLGNTVG